MECKRRHNIIAVRRNLRWLLDASDRHSMGYDEVLSQSFALLKEIELECLSIKNEKKGKCVEEGI